MRPSDILVLLFWTVYVNYIVGNYVAVGLFMLMAMAIVTNEYHRMITVDMIFIDLMWIIYTILSVDSIVNFLSDPTGF